MPHIAVSAGWGPSPCLVRLHGDLDVVSAAAATEELAALIDRGCSTITRDMAQVQFCDLAGLWALLRTSAAFAERAGTITVTGACPSLRLMLAVLPDTGCRCLQLVDAPP